MRDPFDNADIITVQTNLPIPALRWTLWAKPVLQKIGVRDALAQVSIGNGYGYRPGYVVFGAMLAAILWCIIITPLLCAAYLVVNAQLITLIGETILNLAIVLAVCATGAYALIRRIHVRS